MTANLEFSPALRRLAGFLGLCRKAGCLICGTPQICTGLAKSKKPALILLSDHASGGTRKKLILKSRYYGVPLCSVPIDPSALAHAVGKTGAIAAVAVTDPKMAEAIGQRAAEAAAAVLSNSRSSASATKNPHRPRHANGDEAQPPEAPAATDKNDHAGRTPGKPNPGENPPHAATQNPGSAGSTRISTGKEPSVREGKESYL